MTDTQRRVQLATEATFEVPSGRTGRDRRVLLFNPPVYDAQYWARWSQPAGLLRLGTLLKRRGVRVDLLDCMETDAKGLVSKSRRLVDGKPVVVTRDDISKPIYHFGLRWDEAERRMKSLAEPPEQVWVGSVMTYWWESTRDAVRLLRYVFPRAEIVVGGIYPTLAPEHARENLDADIIFQGELSAASNCWTDFSLYETAPTYAILTTSRGCCQRSV